MGLKTWSLPAEMKIIEGHPINRTVKGQTQTKQVTNDLPLDPAFAVYE